MSTFTTATLILALLPLAPLAAQKRNESIQLTMPKIQATFAAYGDLVTLVSADPALKARYKAVRKSLPDTNGRDTMGLTAARLTTTEPRVAGVFRKAGITPEEATDTFETLLGCMFGEAMLQSMKGDASKLPADVAANLAFFRQNKGQIEASFKAFAGKAASLKDVDEDEDQEEDDEEKD